MPCCVFPTACVSFLQLQHLYVSDASFTRDPWSLEQLSWLPKLSSMSLSWDTGLWAPGQVAQEADALQVRCTACCCFIVVGASDEQLHVHQEVLLACHRPTGIIGS